MKPTVFRILSILAIASLLLGGALTLPAARASDLGAYTQHLPIMTSTFYLRMPIMIKTFPLPTVYGIAMAQISGNGAEKIAQASSYWIRRRGVSWAEVEPTKGTRDWSVLAGTEQELLKAASKGMRVILIVQGTPTWAQKLPGYACGPILSTELGTFAGFIHDLVARYSAAPYNVKDWEIWNEPDIAGGDPNSGFGCWGDDNDTFYGGGYYADMLQVVYPQLKAADPNSRLFIGGLLLDCDPRSTTPNNCTTSGHDPKPPLFLEGILYHNGANDGGSYFDGISFHAYDFYGGSLGSYGSGTWNSTSAAVGPVTINKVGFIREVLAKYGVSGKALMNTEAALICDATECENADPSSAFEQTKAIYISQNFAATIALGLDASIWYELWGWRNSGLLYPDLSPRPAYTAFKFSRAELRNATFIDNIGAADVNPITGVRGYKFDRGDRIIWLVWSVDGASHTVQLSATPFAIFGNDGTPQTVTGTTTTITKMPVYLEFRK